MSLVNMSVSQLLMPYNLQRRWAHKQLHVQWAGYLEKTQPKRFTQKSRMSKMGSKCKRAAHPTTPTFLFSMLLPLGSSVLLI